MKPAGLLVLTAVLAISPACTKPGSSSTPPPPRRDPIGGVTADPAPASAPAPAPGWALAGDPDDSIVVLATHHRRQAKDPVEVKFERFRVVKASLDPEQIEGGTATLEIDLTSLKTDRPERDAHLASPDYLDTNRFAAAIVEIGDVKKAGTGFTASAKVKLRGIQRTYPVTFEVIEVKDDWIRIKAEHTFQRLDFRVGGKPGRGPRDDGVGAYLTIKLRLTLRKIAAARAAPARSGGESTA